MVRATVSYDSRPARRPFRTDRIDSRADVLLLPIPATPPHYSASSYPRIRVGIAVVPTMLFGHIDVTVIAVSHACDRMAACNFIAGKLYDSTVASPLRTKLIAAAAYVASTGPLVYGFASDGGIDR